MSSILDWRYFIYRKSDGMLMATGIVQSAQNLINVLVQWGSETYSAQATSNTAISEKTHWYNQSTQQFVAKIAMNPSVINGNQITGLPDPCRAIYKDTEYTVTGGTLTVTSQDPETIEVYLDAPAYLATTVTVQT